MDDITDPQSVLNWNLSATGEPRTDSISHTLIHVQRPAINPEEPNCAICSEMYRFVTSAHPLTDEIHEVPVKLICGHVFGRDCITRWLHEHDSCPKCRAHVLTITRQQRTQMRYARTQEIIEGWREERESYIAKLEAAGGKSSRNALLFIQQQTTSSCPPNAHLEWLTYILVERPDLLQDDRHLAARYWMRHVSRDRPIFHRVLVDFIRQDMQLPLV